MTDLLDLRTQLDAAVDGCRSGELADLIGLLEAVKTRALTRALVPLPTPTATDDVVDVATLSRELHLAPSWLRAKARAGKLPHLRCGKYIKFRRAEVLEALADHRIPPPVRAKKRSNGAGSFPSVSKSDAGASTRTEPSEKQPTHAGIATGKPDERQIEAL